MLCRYSINSDQTGLCQERLIRRSIVCAEFYLSFLHSLPFNCNSLTMWYSTTCPWMVVCPFAANMYSQKYCYSLISPSPAIRVVDCWRYEWYICQQQPDEKRSYACWKSWNTLLRDCCCQWGFRECLELWCASAKGLWMFGLDSLFLSAYSPKYHCVLR